MIIQSSEVHMTAKHEKSESRSYSTQSNINLGTLTNYSSADSEKMSASEQFEAMISQFYKADDSLLKSADEEDDGQSILVMTKDGFKFRTADDQINSEEDNILATIKMFRRLLEAISQQNGASYLNDTSNSDIDEAKNATQSSPIDQSNPTGEFSTGGIHLQMSFKSTFSVEQHEKTDFSSAGTVTTADGKNISFDLDMSMQRDYAYTETNEFTQSVLFKDPIIINYPGSSADLSDEKFAFDIDADGNEDLISYLNSGAMLALDKNEDGVINDGSELFGALSGNGFADLAAYDEDGNNYIDEADSIFNDLKLWTKTADDDSLTSLSSMDVGAIYLGATETPFDLKGDDNQFNGQVKASSFYLTDAGEVGSVQQIDMVV